MLGSWDRREAQAVKFICPAAFHHDHQLIQYNSRNPKSSALCVHPPQDLRAGLWRQSLFHISLVPLLSKSLAVIADSLRSK